MATIFQTVNDSSQNIESEMKRSESGQRSFRIRKYSRSSSRSSSAMHSHREGGEDSDEKENSDKNINKQTIENSPDLTCVTDINLKKISLNLKDKFPKLMSKEDQNNKYKKERDILIKLVK
jgi:hypothetical protein